MAGALAVSPESSIGTPNGPAPTSSIEQPAPTPGSSGFVEGAQRPPLQVSLAAHAPVGVPVALMVIETSRACVTSTTVHPVARTLQSAPRAAAAKAYDAFFRSPMAGGLASPFWKARRTTSPVGGI